MTNHSLLASIARQASRALRDADKLRSLLTEAGASDRDIRKHSASLTAKRIYLIHDTLEVMISDVSGYEVTDGIDTDPEDDRSDRSNGKLILS